MVNFLKELKRMSEDLRDIPQGYPNSSALFTSTEEIPLYKACDALGHKIRVRIVETIFARGPLSYVELCAAVGLEYRHAGKFGYHLKKLVEAGFLVTKDNLYNLTELGERFYRNVKEALTKGDEKDKKSNFS